MKTLLLISTYLLVVLGTVAGVEHTVHPSAQYPWKELAWDQAHCRYLMGLYYGTWPWLREFVNVNRLGLPAIKIWAYDHLACSAAGSAAHNRRIAPSSTDSCRLTRSSR